MSQSKLDHIIQEELALYEKEKGSLVLQEQEDWYSQYQNIYKDATSWIPDWLGGEWLKEKDIRGPLALLGIAIVSARFGGPALRRFISKPAGIAKNQGKNLIKVQRSFRGLSPQTQSALSAELRALETSSSKFYKSIDDFVDGGGDLMVNISKLNKNSAIVLRNNTTRGISKILTANQKLITKIDDLLKTNPGRADARALKTVKKNLLDKSKGLDELKTIVSNTKNVEDLTAVIVASSKGGPRALLRTVKKFKAIKANRGAAAATFSGVRGAALAGAGVTKFAFKLATNRLFFWTVTFPELGKWAFTNLVTKVMNLSPEEAKKIWKQIGGGVYDNLETLEAAYEAWFGGKPQVLEQERFVRLMMGGEEERPAQVELMKNIISNLVILKILPRSAEKNNYPSYEESLQKFKDFFTDIENRKGPAEIPIVKKNLANAIDSASKEIQQGKFPFYKFIEGLEAQKGQAGRIVPSGVPALEYLFQLYFFHAIKEKYKSTPIDHDKLYSNPSARADALNEMIDSLKAQGASAKIVEIMERINASTFFVRKNQKLRDFIYKKYFMGAVAPDLDNLKNRQTRKVSKDLLQIVK